MASSRVAKAGEGVVGAAIVTFALLTPFLRHWRTRWGATPAEVSRALPGDDLVPRPKWQYTQAITIRDTATRVWPWLVQMGQGRGGFYSYESLENLVGCQIQNSDNIIPEFQHLAAGDNIRLHPEGPFPVAMVDPAHAIVLHIDSRTGASAIPVGKEAGNYLITTWVFFLESLDDKTTRLISRLRFDYNPRIRNRLRYGPCLVEPISSTMQRKMLLGIKDRVERGIAH
jgi:hypothetical protein